MTTTRTETRRDLVREESIQFIRASSITLKLSGARPNTRMNVFFDGIKVNEHCGLAGSSMGSPIITNGSGEATINFQIPSGKFNVGTKSVVVTDAPTIESAEQAGSVFGIARGTYYAEGKTQIFQTTETKVVTKTREVVVVRPSPARDPLAQSFFTYGIKGGMFVSSIELFFNTKDQSGIPVQVELRKMINGYPDKLQTNNPHLVSVLTPSNVNTSEDGSVPTKFEFNPPIYLEEDSDYAFVVYSNSKEYNLFTSRVGDVSLETGKRIFEQPYIGSLFKSENNITWQPEQFEDIKFRINRCKFTANAGQLVFNLQHADYNVWGSNFITAQGSARIKLNLDVEHGLEPGSKVVVSTDGLGTYNGIPATALSGEFAVVETPSRKEIVFDVSAPATSSGPVMTSGVVRHIQVDAGGSGYDPLNTTISIIGGGGTGATATPVIVDGQIQSVQITSAGSGYISTPNVNISSPTGTGASAVAIVEANMRVVVNAPYQSVSSNFSQGGFGQSSVKARLSPTLLNYEGGNLPSYSAGRTIDIALEGRTELGQNSVLMSSFNENNILGGNSSAKLLLDMESRSEYASPVIDLRGSQGFKHFNYVINDQAGETLDSLNGSASVASITVTSGGSGYTQPPIVTIVGGGGSGADAIPVMTGSSVTSITVTNGGAGYTTIPEVIITPAVGDVTGLGATARAALTPYNSEILASGGNAKTRYITKIMNIEFPSNGIRVFADIGSSVGSSVDWYIRGTLSGSGEDIRQKSWIRLDCDSQRNLSSSQLEPIEYEFYKNGMAEYDSFQLKCVLLCKDPTKSPRVYRYRAITLL